MPFTDKEGHLTKAFQKKKNMTLQVKLLKEYANRNCSCRWLNFFRKRW